MQIPKHATELENKIGFNSTRERLPIVCGIMYFSNGFWFIVYKRAYGGVERYSLVIHTATADYSRLLVIYKYLALRQRVEKEIDKRLNLLVQIGG